MDLKAFVLNWLIWARGGGGGVDRVDVASIDPIPAFLGLTGLHHRIGSPSFPDVFSHCVVRISRRS